MRYAFFNRRRLLPLLALCLTMLAGCTLLTTSQLPFAKKKPEYQVPRQMVPVWSDTVLHQPSATATRGFGGRLMFYGHDKHKPILVDGSLVVYAWDDSKGSMERTPDRKYVFPSETLQTHYSESRLGHSYSFWVPWDVAGGSLQHLTLISRFLSSEGTELTATPAHVVLQGPSDSSPFPNEISKAGNLSDVSKNQTRLTARRKRIDSGIQQVGFETDAELEGQLRSPEDLMNRSSRNSESREMITYPQPTHPGLHTSEIGLTPGFYERNMQGSRLDQRSSDFITADADDLLGPLPMTKSRVPESMDKEPSPTSSTSESGDDAESAQESDRHSTRLPPFESRVRTSRVTRSSDDHVRKAPLRAKWLNGLPETPRSSPNAIEQATAAIPTTAAAVLNSPESMRRMPVSAVLHTNQQDE